MTGFDYYIKGYTFTEIAAALGLKKKDIEELSVADNWMERKREHNASIIANKERPTIEELFGDSLVDIAGTLLRVVKGVGEACERLMILELEKDEPNISKIVADAYKATTILKIVAPDASDGALHTEEE